MAQGSVLLILVIISIASLSKVIRKKFNGKCARNCACGGK